MEEDIKILEELISWEGKNVEIRDYEIRAIENLIARYKELEKINNKYKVVKTLNEIQEYKLELDYIPKSKVKEILNKLSNHKYKCNFNDIDFLQDIIIEIQQLLED